MVGCGGIPSIASSTFSSYNEDWTLIGDVDERPELRGTGGNPGGHICGTDLNTGDIWYFVAPGKYLGDVSRAYGKRLTFDMKQSIQHSQLHGRDVILRGGGFLLTYNTRGTPGLDWTPYSVTLDAEASSGWVRDDTQEPVTEAELRATLSDLNSLRLRGEFADGPDTECLDNVYFGRP